MKKRLTAKKTKPGPAKGAVKGKPKAKAAKVAAARGKAQKCDRAIKAKANAKARADAKRERAKASALAKRERDAERRKRDRERRKERESLRREKTRDRERRRIEAAKKKADAKAERDAAKAAAGGFHFVRRPDESDEQADARRASERREHRNFKKRHARFEGDERKYIELERECRQWYLRNHFPDWIMDDAVAEAVWALWDRRTQTTYIQRKEARKAGYEAWRALDDHKRLQEDLYESARKWGVNITRQEAGELMPKFESVTAGARRIHLESGRHLYEFGFMRVESDFEVYDRLLAGSERGRDSETPLDAVVASETRDRALALLTKQERRVVELCQHKARNQKEAAKRLRVSPARVSDLIKSANAKIAKHIGPSPETRHSGESMAKASPSFKEYIKRQLELLRENRRPAFEAIPLTDGWGKRPAVTNRRERGSGNPPKFLKKTLNFSPIFRSRYTGRASTPLPNP